MQFGRHTPTARTRTPSHSAQAIRALVMAAEYPQVARWATGRGSRSPG